MPNYDDDIKAEKEKNLKRFSPKKNGGLSEKEKRILKEGGFKFDRAPSDSDAVEASAWVYAYI